VKKIYRAAFLALSITCLNIHAMVPSLKDLAVKAFADTITEGQLSHEDIPDDLTEYSMPDHLEKKIKQRLLCKHSNVLGKHLLTSSLIGHVDGITSVAFSPDGKYALTGSWDNTACLWDIELAGSSLKQLAQTIQEQQM
jgi:WD40 repeat protein